jgi:hypothetical protein
VESISCLAVVRRVGDCQTSPGNQPSIEKSRAPRSGRNYKKKILVEGLPLPGNSFGHTVVLRYCVLGCLRLGLFIVRMVDLPYCLKVATSMWHRVNFPFPK